MNTIRGSGTLMVFYRYRRSKFHSINCDRTGGVQGTGKEGRKANLLRECVLQRVQCTGTQGERKTYLLGDVAMNQPLSIEQRQELRDEGLQFLHCHV